VLQLLKADDGCEAARLSAPKPKGRFCDGCRAFITVLGRTEGVFCGSTECPFPRLSYGGVSDITPGEQRSDWAGFSDEPEGENGPVHRD
jgi:hypothetical protein